MASQPDCGVRPHAAELTTAHCTIVGLDIEGFGQHHRSNPNRVRMRDGLYEAVERAFGVAGIPWTNCRSGDRGDGVIVLVSAEVPKIRCADGLPDALAGELCRYNATHPPEERIRLRVAIHAGEINYDRHGFTGASVIHACRLLDSPAIRAVLAGNAAPLAVISSAWFFDEVIRHSEHSSAAAYRRSVVTNKETTAQAWIRLVPETADR
ncbi:MAG TPA: hypothetical protein VGL47_40545 [Amycolatopsis sp.]|uniref:Guanylate cyclase domain-containing protein n=1 Tax=Amycolatopsis nalaikhensis TaxID=715472 RepID=A0ABY8Y1E0_9PSEU|nr:hypothetical protein [Amycolatopsis sp. 2-2]WIV61822.1 hypothetical protein QP939_26045 [Amycolatopsis sp. 2-2]